MEQSQGMQSPAVYYEFPKLLAAKSLPPPPPPAVPARKYISLFRIDGVPIMPPLMTAEKRRQMQKIKEKTIKLERKLQEKRKQQEQSQIATELQLQQQQLGSPHQSSNTSCGSASQRFIEHSDDVKQLQEQENSYRLLTNLMETKNQKEYANTSTNTMTEFSSFEQLPERNLNIRMQKLQKSETLIYDNRSNSVILSDTTVAVQEPLVQQCQTQQLQQNENAIVNFLTPQKPVHFSLDLNGKQIPSICVDPPTPLMSQRSFCDTLSATESVDSIEITNMKPARTIVQNKSFTDEVSSSDESFTRSQTPTPHSPSARKCSLDDKKTITNITAKIKQFEQQIEKNALSMSPPQRSATSPSLKPLVMATPLSSLNIVSDSQTDNGLVRSNSFTLAGPSKALLEHIRQQKSQVKSPLGRAVNGSATKRMSPSASATRDTVESKAKRVQKVELKSRASHMHATTRAAQAKMSTSSLVNCSSTYGSSGSSTMIFKNKRSPYELKASTKNKITRQFKKATPASSSSATALKQVKSKISMPALTATISAKPAAVLKNADMLNQIEADHRQKFMNLIAQQQEEQKRLQLAFEAQQKMLLEQLSSEMSKTQLNQTSTPNTPTSATSQQIQSHNFSPQIDCISNQNSLNTSIQSDFSELTLKSSTNISNDNVVSAADVSVDSTSISTAGDLTSLDTFDDLSTCSTALTTATTPALNSGRCTPRRRLFSREPSTPTAGGPMTLAGSSIVGNGIVGNMLPSTATAMATTAAVTTSSANRRQQHQVENERRMHAATIINAYARGFLTRRLFQTEQIQRIVQTIRDTLIFVLNLHLETIDNTEEANTPANIKLKARLLQQLSSASRTLHLVFFQTTVKERMEIVSRDRKRMRTKLLAMNIKRSPRVALRNA